MASSQVTSPTQAETLGMNDHQRTELTALWKNAPSGARKSFQKLFGSKEEAGLTIEQVENLVKGFGGSFGMNGSSHYKISLPHILSYRTMSSFLDSETEGGFSEHGKNGGHTGKLMSRKNYKHLRALFERSGLTPAHFEAAQVQ